MKEDLIYLIPNMMSLMTTREHQKKLEELIISFNKDAEEDGLLDIDIFFEEDEDD